MNLSDSLKQFKQSKPNVSADDMMSFLAGWTAKEVQMDCRLPMEEKAKALVESEYPMYDDFKELLIRVYMDGANGR